MKITYHRLDIPNTPEDGKRAKAEGYDLSHHGSGPFAGRFLIGSREAMPRTPVQNIILEAERIFGVRSGRIIAIDRNHAIVKARFAAYWCARDVTGYSYPQIGRIFKRDNSTVYHGVKRCIEIQRNDPEYFKQCSELLRRAKNETV